MCSQPRRRWWIRALQWAAGIVVGLVVLIVVVTSIYVHTSTAPAMLTLPKAAGTPSGVATVDGVWNAGPGSIVGWRAQQILIGQQSPIVGRTDKVWGSITISDGSVSQGSFVVNMAALTSSTSKTTQHKAFDVDTYPTASLMLTSPIALGAVPADGAVERFPAVGNIMMHGVTHAVRFTTSAKRVGDSVYVLADIAFPFNDWNISLGGVPFLADIQSPATIEVLLNLTQGPSNPASKLYSDPTSTGDFL
jgi:polyisoprenoid-binding protein YceI